MQKRLMAVFGVFFSIFSISCCYGISVGASYGGGTVFCVSKVADTTKCVPTGSDCYGLIMANEDQVNYDSNANHGVHWASVATSIPGALSLDDGAANTAAIIAALPGDNASNNAAWLSHNYRDTEGHTDWYLPSMNELYEIYLYAKANNLIGSGCTGSVALGVQCLVGGHGEERKVYWSSSEYSGNSNLAWNQNFSVGGHDYDNKIFPYFGVRAVRAFNNLPIQQLNNFNKSGYENSAITFTVTDFIAASCDSLANVKIVSLPISGVLSLSGSAVTSNQVIPVGSLDNLAYIPNTGYLGNDSFTWNGSSDGTTYAASAASVNIAVNDQAPTITNIAKSTYMDTDLKFAASDFSSNFNGYQSNPLAKIKIISLPGNGILKLSGVDVTLNQEGVDVTLNQEIETADLGNLTYTPNMWYIGGDNFSWNGSDGTMYAASGAKVNIAINDQAPTITSITKSAYEDTELKFAASDFSSNFNGYQDNPLAKIKIISLPENGILRMSDTNINVSSNQEITADNLCYLVFIPKNGWIGATSFSWNGSDGAMYAENPANVSITIDDQPPTINNVNESGYENADIMFNTADFTSNFNGYSGNSLAKIKIVSLPINGILKLSGVDVTLDQEIETDNLGNLTYAPDKGFVGKDSFNWNGSDGTMYATSDAKVNITIAAAGGSVQDPIFFTDPIGYCKKNWAPCAGASFGAGSFTVALVTGVIGTCIKYKQYKLNRIRAGSLLEVEAPLLGGAYEVVEGMVAGAAGEAAAGAGVVAAAGVVEESAVGTV